MLGKGLQEPLLEHNRKLKLLGIVKLDLLIKSTFFLFPGDFQMLHYPTQASQEVLLLSYLCMSSR